MELHEKAIEHACIFTVNWYKKLKLYRKRREYYSLDDIKNFVVLELLHQFKSKLRVCQIASADSYKPTLLYSWVKYAIFAYIKQVAVKTKKLERFVHCIDSTEKVQLEDFEFDTPDKKPINEVVDFVKRFLRPDEIVAFDYYLKTGSLDPTTSDANHRATRKIRYVIKHVYCNTQTGDLELSSERKRELSAVKPPPEARHYSRIKVSLSSKADNSRSSQGLNSSRESENVIV